MLEDEKNYDGIGELPQITCGNNPKLINASAKVDIRETEYAGKEIYAKENIAPGEVLLIEEPSVSFLLHKFHGTHCSECFIRLYAPIGCPDCVNVAFCSRKCRDIALSTYHKYECKILLLMFGSGMSSLSYLAFRAITQEGLDNCLKIYDAINKKDKTNEQNDDNNKENEEKLSRSARRRRKLKNKLLTKTQTSDTSNLSDNLASISLKEKESPIDTRLYELVNHNSERKSSDFFERTLMTAFLLKCLQRIHFFKTTSPDNEVPNDDEIKVASLIFKNLQSFQFNAHMIFDIILKSDNILGDKLSENIALAVYPTVSRFNHDCVLSSGRYHIGKKVVIRALKTFQPGESVPENYGPKIDENNCMERQMLLMGRYWFKCMCKACVEKWPTADNLTNNMAKLKCPTKGCYKLYKIDQITDKPIFCNMCRKKVDMFAVLNLLYACEVKYKKAFQLIEKNEILTPIKYLSEALDEFYKIAVPPHNLTHKSQVMLYYLYSYFGNTYKLPIIKLDKFHSDYFNMKRNSNIQMSV
ncbi:hypothetical protein M0804_015218 [Polistes exclamans]|nr:hypothetical protein M0804_015219 [Polistes exclamans]KAI4473705.1 hypothetical protein M0804_015218 [Polistes exclamans]